MLLVHQLKLKPGFTEDDLRKKVCTACKIMDSDINSLAIHKLSIDARKKPEIFMNVSVVCDINHERSVVSRLKNDNVVIYEPEKYILPKHGDEVLGSRPVIVGSGPAGLFAAYFLALEGYKPIVLERGFDVESRTREVLHFWETGELNVNCNVQFGEGGAGTFSDGKLNTLVKDKYGRNRLVLETFVKFGADESILYDAKPHIGTDVLSVIVKNMREAIVKLGGEFRFNAQFTDFKVENDKLTSVEINGMINLDTEVCVLACGHSARDTFKMLYDKGVTISQKDFAVGLRIEHSQNWLNNAMYGNDPEMLDKLPPASYKLAYKAKNDRGVYSFCMCPGGYVVNASSESCRLCVNGMSYSKRDGINSNSAIVVNVRTEDFGSDHPLAGMEFQRRLEGKAYAVGLGRIPVEFYSNFKSECEGSIPDSVSSDIQFLYDMKPQTKGNFGFARVSSILPKELNDAIIEGIENFGKIIPGFNDEFSILSGIEARTSSPVRIDRNDEFESVNVKGLYPCGEGAGYAGGITSAAMDGIKVFEAICSKYKSFD